MLLNVNVNVTGVFGPTLLGLTDLPIEIAPPGPVTTRVALAGPVEPFTSVLVKDPTPVAGMVFVYEDAVALVTETVIVHDVDAGAPPAGIVAPESATVPVPAAAVTVPPAHVVDALGTGATTRPAGSVSVSPELSSVCDERTFAIRIVSVDVPFG
jgi:hypothetical protein